MGRSKRLQDDRNVSNKLRYSYKYDKLSNIFLYDKNVHKIKKIGILLKTYCTSSRQEVFGEKDLLNDFAKFTGKHLLQSLFFNKVTG